MKRKEEKAKQEGERKWKKTEADRVERERGNEIIKSEKGIGE